MRIPCCTGSRISFISEVTRLDCSFNTTIFRSSEFQRSRAIGSHRNRNRELIVRRAVTTRRSTSVNPHTAGDGDGLICGSVSWDLHFERPSRGSFMLQNTLVMFHRFHRNGRARNLPTLRSFERNQRRQIICRLGRPVSITMKAIQRLGRDLKRHFVAWLEILLPIVSPDRSNKRHMGVLRLIQIKLQLLRIGFLFSNRLINFGRRREQLNVAVILLLFGHRQVFFKTCKRSR